MNNFTYCNPTEIIFGKGSIGEIAERVPEDQPTLMLYGGGSIKRNGVYDQVQDALSDHDHIIEFGGIEPNPTHETCMKALEAVQANQVSFVLAVGGGSVLDAAKYIAAAARYEGDDPWKILQNGGEGVNDALPIGTVLTLPATGSEANGNSVISRQATQEKLAFGSPHVFPRFSVLDPETTYSLPAKQVRNGVVDAFIHVMEQYATYPAEAPVQDRLAEGIVKTLLEVGPATIANPTDYDARAAFMWSATLALNTLIGCGVPQDWFTHMIGHELTAYYGLDHAESLAVILPGVWTHQLQRKEAKLAQLGQRLWGLDNASQTIERTEAFFHSVDMPTRLSDYDIDADEAAARIRARFADRGVAFGEHEDMTADDAGDVVALRA